MTSRWYLFSASTYNYFRFPSAILNLQMQEVLDIQDGDFRRFEIHINGHNSVTITLIRGKFDMWQSHTHQTESSHHTITFKY